MEFLLSLVNKDRHWGMSYQVRLVLARIDSQDIAGNFDGRANHHDRKEPGSVSKKRLVRDCQEYEAVHNRSDDGQGKGWIVHPHILIVCHVELQNFVY